MGRSRFIIAALLFLGLDSQTIRQKPNEMSMTAAANAPEQERESKHAKVSEPQLHTRESRYVVESSVDSPRSLRRFMGELLVELTDPALASTLQANFPWIDSMEVVSGPLHLLRFQEAKKPFAEAQEDLQQSGWVQATEANFAVLLAQQSDQRSAPLEGEPLRSVQPRSFGGQEAAKHEACILDSGLESKLHLWAGQSLNLSSLGNRQEIDDVLGHGSLVFGIVAGLAEKDSKPKTQGRICVVKVFEDDGYARLSSILLGLQWAAERSQVINLSFGLYQDSMFLRRSIEKLVQRNFLLVASAGNDTTEAVLYPAAYPGVMAIASHNDQYQRSEFSNWSDGIDYYLPGENIAALIEDGVTRTLTGTSAAAAMFTRLAVQSLRLGHNVQDTLDLFQKRSIEQFQEKPYLPESYKRLSHDLLFPRQFDHQGVPTYITRFHQSSDIIFGSKISFAISWYHQSEKNSLPFSLILHHGQGQEKKIPIDFSSVQTEAGSQHLHLDLDLKSYRIKLEDAKEFVFELRPRGTQLVGPRFATVQVRPTSIQKLKLRQVWATPLDFISEESEATFSLIVQNRSQELQGDLSLRVYAIPAVHEGLARTPRQFLGEFQLDQELEAESYHTFEVKIPSIKAQNGKLSFYGELYQGGVFQDSLFKSYRQSSPYQALPQYAQKVHRYMVDEAIKLLQKQGIIIPDLMSPSLQATYRGQVGDKNEWPSIGFGDFSLPTGEVEARDYWDEAMLSEIKGFFGIKRLTILDGAHDADAIDIAFGYSFEDVFDSHFWIVDKHDDDGLDSNGKNHHSAMTKLRALMYGGGKLRHGAIDHYRQGHKVAAWWFMGHAAHLIGDLTVPSHVNNENAHGTYGDAYHDWIDDGAYTRWTADHPLIAGKGFVNPYTSQNAGDPLRYLAYTSAQLGNSFAWASTLVGTTFGANGNRIAAGDFPHYDDVLRDLFAAMPHRPLLEWHINKDEVKDVWGDCDLVDWIGPTEKVSDCKDKDGHKDRDNTDEHGNDKDGDLSRIGDSNFTYGVRAIAGLIYYFAKETGQIP